MSCNILEKRTQIVQNNTFIYLSYYFTCWSVGVLNDFNMNEQTN